MDAIRTHGPQQAPQGAPPRQDSAPDSATAPTRQANAAQDDKRDDFVPSPDMADGDDDGGRGGLPLVGGAGDDSPLKAMEARDQEVRKHEAEHQRVAGEFAVGGPTFEEVSSKRTGRSFAVGGKVRVDTAAIEGDPRKTLEKMEKIQRAALAPDTPSEQDRRVAADAASKESKARSDLRQVDEGRRQAGLPVDPEPH